MNQTQENECDVFHDIITKKEYDKNGNLIFEGQQKNNQRWCGIIKMFDKKNNLIFDGVFKDGNRSGKEYDIHKNVLGRYERSEVMPSIEIARKIADILDVSLDYLTGKVEVEMDKKTQKRILEVSKFKEKDREMIFSVIDAFIAKAKMDQIILLLYIFLYHFLKNYL